MDFSDNKYIFEELGASHFMRLINMRLINAPTQSITPTGSDLVVSPRNSYRLVHRKWGLNQDRSVLNKKAKDMERTERI